MGLWLGSWYLFFLLLLLSYFWCYFFCFLNGTVIHLLNFLFLFQQLILNTLRGLFDIALVFLQLCSLFIFFAWIFSFYCLLFLLFLFVLLRFLVLKKILATVITFNILSGCFFLSILEA